MSHPAPRPADRRGAVSDANVRRSLERETGIEPATNSLEGCDSTTELLPPSSRSGLLDPPLDFGGLARRISLSQPYLTLSRPYLSLSQPRWLASRSSSSRCIPSPREEERRLVAREGFEPSKPLGRQIYSLLRLTASLPRLNPLSAPSSRLLVGDTQNLELAKGFEPPTC